MPYDDDLAAKLSASIYAEKQKQLLYDAQKANEQKNKNMLEQLGYELQQQKKPQMPDIAAMLPDNKEVHKVWKMMEEQQKADDDDFFKKINSSPFATVTIKAEPLDLSQPQQASPYSRLLIMGDSGTGKTHFAGTMPKPFIADLDRGIATLRGKNVKARTYVPDGLGWDELEKEVMEWRQGPQYGCETFVLDSLTMASEAALEAVMLKNGRKGGQPNVQDWGEAIRRVKSLLGYLTTLPCHVCVTAHNQIVKDEMVGDIQWLPLIYGKDLPHRLGIWFDEVYATTIKETISGGAKKVEYLLQVKPDSRTKILKSRMNTDGKMFDMFETPDFTTLRKKASVTPNA